MNNLLMAVGWGEVLILVVIVLLLFGAKRIPELMKSMGKGVRSFKDGINGLEEDITKSDDKPKDKE